LVFAALLLSPFFNVLGDRTSQSFDLYFRNFEFNASIYYIFRWIGFLVKGYNLIHFLGPFLAIASAVLIFVYALREKQPDLHNWPTAALFAFSIYFLCSPIVHPWYLTTLVALSVFTNYRFPIVWSGMAFLSYSAYRNGSYDENPWLIAIEYFVVFAILLYELFGPTKQRRSEIV